MHLSLKNQYIGCFGDKPGDRDLSHHMSTSDTNTVYSCVKLCRNRGFSFAGIQVEAPFYSVYRYIFLTSLYSRNKLSTDRVTYSNASTKYCTHVIRFKKKGNLSSGLYISTRLLQAIADTCHIIVHGRFNVGSIPNFIQEITLKRKQKTCPL